MSAVSWALTWLLSGAGVMFLGQLVKSPLLKGWRAKVLIFCLCIAAAAAGMAVRGELPALGWSWGDIGGSLGRLIVVATPIFLTAHSLYRAVEQKIKAVVKPLKPIEALGRALSGWFQRRSGPEAVTTPPYE